MSASLRALSGGLTAAALTLVVLAGTTASCGGGQPSATHADIRVVSLLVGVTSSGLDWDGSGSFDSFYPADIASALLSADPYTAAAAVISDVALDLRTPADAPDPVVATRIYVDGVATGASPVSSTDTFFPTFASIEWLDIPLDAGLRIEVNVTDEDHLIFEPICVAQLHTNDVVMALDLGRAHQVDVSAECASQLLFVGLSVVASD